MPFIVTAPCIDCRHATCIDVCPMDCFVAGPDFLAAGGEPPFGDAMSSDTFKMRRTFISRPSHG